jgi:hypothetical protein
MRLVAQFTEEDSPKSQLVAISEKPIYLKADG